MQRATQKLLTMALIIKVQCSIVELRLTKICHHSRTKRQSRWWVFLFF